MREALGGLTVRGNLRRAHERCNRLRGAAAGAATTRQRAAARRAKAVA